MWETQPKLKPHPLPWCKVSMHSALKWFSRVVKPISTNYPNRAHYSRLTSTDVAYYFWTVLPGLGAASTFRYVLVGQSEERMSPELKYWIERGAEHCSFLQGQSFILSLYATRFALNWTSFELMSQALAKKQTSIFPVFVFSTHEISQLVCQLHNVRHRFGQNVANQVICLFFFPPFFLSSFLLSDTVLPRATKFQSHLSLRKRPLVALCLCFSFQSAWVPRFMNLQWFITIPNSAEQQQGKESRRTQWWECALFPFSLCHVDNRTTCLPGSHISITLWKFATRCILITLCGKKKKE